MNKIIYLILFLLPFIGGNLVISALDIEKIDALHENEKYDDELRMLESQINVDKSQAGILYRYIRVLFIQSGKETKKKNQISILNKCIDLGDNYLKTASGNNSEKAQFLFWFTISRLVVQEKKNSLGVLFMVDGIMKALDDVIELDSNLMEPYHLKAILYRDIPLSNKYLMSRNFSMALSQSPKNIVVTVDFAKGLIKRDWDTIKKEKTVKKNENISDGTPADVDDKEYAKQLLSELIQYYTDTTQLKEDEINGLKEAKDLLKDFK